MARDEARDHKTAKALLEATERLLIKHGHSGVSTRRIAEEAGQPHGLVRYHFGSLEALLLRTLEQAAGGIIERQRTLYESDQPFVEKWRTAMELLDSDLQTGFPKLTAELFAKAWNEPAYREGLHDTMRAFTDMLAEAVAGAAAEYDANLGTEHTLALATLIRTFQIGMIIERLAGIEVGHAELLAAIEERLSETEGGRDASQTS